jgi:hypothetical protein
MTSNPLFNRAAVVAVVALVVSVLAQFGVVVPEEIQNRLIEVIAIVGPLAVAWWAHRHQKAADKAEAETEPEPEQ